MDIRRGHIYFVSPGDFVTTGSEMKLKNGRPGIVVSCDELNRTSTNVNVCFMTTKEKKALPTHFMTCSPGTVSTVLCEQISTVSKERLSGYCGRLDEDEMERLDECLKQAFALKEYGYTKATKQNYEEPKQEDKSKITLSIEEYYKLVAERDAYKAICLNKGE